MAKLGVNIDHVATLRQARGTTYPDPILAAKLAQDAGADLITCHLREDRRHIQDADLPAIQAAISVPLNLEMAATEEMLAVARKLKPAKVTLVPERREELTTEGGLDVLAQVGRLKDFVSRLREAKIPVSLFIDPDEKQLRAGRPAGPDEVELHTGRYCEAEGKKQEEEFRLLQEASRAAQALGFLVAAGHGLNYRNILPFQRIPEIQEYNIGHSIVAHAVIVGWERAVREMRSLVP
jgi:pyridoxine 5-phosphate synthase